MPKLEPLNITYELSSMRSKVQGLITEQLQANEQKGSPETSGQIKNRFVEGLKKAGRSEQEINYIVFNLQ